MRYLALMALVLLTCSSAIAREPASTEGKIESKNNGKEKSYDYDEYVVVPRDATAAYKRNMARLKELEEENKKLREEKKVVKVEKEAPELDRNSLSLIGGATTTALNAEPSPGVLKVSTGLEPDAGLMFQHDFDDFRGTAAATLRGNMYLGVGIRF